MKYANQCRKYKKEKLQTFGMKITEILYKFVSLSKLNIQLVIQHRIFSATGPFQAKALLSTNNCKFRKIYFNKVINSTVL